MTKAEELKRKWAYGQFPFDVAKCGNCITEHATLGLECGHVEIAEAVRALGLKNCAMTRGEPLASF